MTPDEPILPAAACGHTDAALLAMHYEQEGARLARLIHDGPAQQLTAAMIELSLWKSDIEGGRAISPDALQGLAEVLQSVSTDMRNVTNSLRPRVLDLFGLGAAIESIAKRHGNCQFHQLTETFSIKTDLAIQFVRVAESIMAGIDRTHRLEMELAQPGQEIVLQIHGAQLDVPDHATARLGAFNGRIVRTPRGIAIHLPLVS
jgi:signal transduction histidine kinase